LPQAPPGSDIKTYRWEPSEKPVLSTGANSEWDSHDALNPSIVRFRGLLYNLYSGFDGRTWHTGLATSENGRNWTKRGRILSPDGKEGNYIAANGTALVFGNLCFYWYQTGPKPTPYLAVAVSEDCTNFARRAEPALVPGPYMSWDERGVGDPYVIQAGDSLYMFYLGQDRARRQRLGIARSRDGYHWAKLRSNPVLELGDINTFDENGLGEPAVWHAGGSWWMLYTGRDRNENRRLGLALSTDGLEWTRLPDVFAGSESWNSKVLCDPTVLPAAGDELEVWYGGGDKASPDENLNGQIGFGRLIPVR
jgi:predicted GH43/DUF377 family glycosyl hydrolase